MKRYIDLDLEKCSACGACAVACMDQNDIDLAAGDSCYRKLQRCALRHILSCGMPVKGWGHGFYPL